MNDNIFLGGVIKEYNVFFFFLGIITVYIVIWILQRTSFRDSLLNLFFIISIILIVYLSIVFIINHTGYSIWIWFLLMIGFNIIFIIQAGVRSRDTEDSGTPRLMGIFAIQISMVIGATLVYFLTNNLNLIIRLGLIAISTFPTNVLTHFFYNLVVILFRKKDKSTSFTNTPSQMPEEKDIRDFWN